MKKFPMPFIFLITATLLYGCIYASPVSDSLPPCILKMKQKDSLLIIDRYDYKGERWYGVSRKINEYDRMFIIKFYNDDCTLVATWHGGHDQIVPESIDQTKIVNTEKVKAPEEIIKLAIKNNALYITEYEYDGQTLYFLNERSNYSAPKSMYIIEPYYDKNGREIMRFQRANGGVFLRGQQWVPNTVEPKKLIKKGVIWYNLSAMNKPVKLKRATTGIPPCILLMKPKDTLAIVDEYNYKGQRWYSLRGFYPEKTKSGPPAIQLSIREFYNKDCKLVCKWATRGLPRINNVTPDTIQKEMIIKIVAAKDTFNKKYLKELPAVIIILALKKYSDWIEQNGYVYRFRSAPDNSNSSVIKFEGPYYDSDGKTTPADNDRGHTTWWHEVDGKYRQTQFRPGYK